MLLSSLDLNMIKWSYIAGATNHKESVRIALKVVEISKACESIFTFGYVTAIQPGKLTESLETNYLHINVGSENF